MERGDPQFNALFNAWREWGFHEVDKIKNHTRLVNPPQPAELSEHAGLCSEVALPTLGDQRCVIGQAKHRFVTDRSLLTTPGTWMITGYTSEGRPISFVGMSLLGLGLEVGMDLKEGSDYMKLYHVWLSQKRRSMRSTVEVKVIELDGEIFKSDNLEMPAVLMDAFAHLPLPIVPLGGRVATKQDTVGAETNRYTGHNFNYAGYPMVFYSGSHDTPGVHCLDNSPTGDIHLFIGYLVQWCEKNQVRLPADARYPTYNERSRHRSTCSEECRMNML